MVGFDAYLSVFLLRKRLAELLAVKATKSSLNVPRELDKKDRLSAGFLAMSLVVVQIMTHFDGKLGFLRRWPGHFGLAGDLANFFSQGVGMPLAEHIAGLQWPEKGREAFLMETLAT